MLVGSCADNWSVQLLDDSLVPITRVSSCSSTLVRITNCLRPGALGPGNSGWKIRVVSCSVNQRTYAGSGIQCPAPRTLVRILVGHSCADNWNAQVLELILCGQPDVTSCLGEQRVFSAEPWDRRGWCLDLLRGYQVPTPGDHAEGPCAG